MLNGNLHYLQVDLHLFVDLWMQHFIFKLINVLKIANVTATCYQVIIVYKYIHTIVDLLCENGFLGVISHQRYKDQREIVQIIEKFIYRSTSQ